MSYYVVAKYLFKPSIMHVTYYISMPIMPSILSIPVFANYLLFVANYLFIGY